MSCDYTKVMSADESEFINLKNSADVESPEKYKKSDAEDIKRCLTAHSGGPPKDKYLPFVELKL